MKRPRVLLLEEIHPQALDVLRADAVLRPLPALDGPPTDALLDGVEAIVTRGAGRVTRELIDRLPCLRVVARCGVGLDNIDLAALAERDVTVINAPGSTTATTAEHTMMLMLASRRHLVPTIDAVRGDDWAVRDRYGGDECSGKKLGIVGFGAIGARVATLATAFGMRVQYWNRSPRQVAYPGVSFDALLETSDVISLHVALTQDTRSMIGERELAAMSKRPTLINTARGALVDEDAVVAALDSGRLDGYAADCVWPQPPAAGSALIRHPRALITPHAAALTVSTYARTCMRTVRNLLACLAGEEIDEDCIVAR